MSRLEITVISAAVALLAFVLEVVRRRRLSEGYALLWMAVGFGGVVVGIGRPLIDRFSDTLGVSYGTSLVFGAGFIFLVVVCINLSMHVSHLEDQVTVLAEEVAVLSGPRPPEPDGPVPMPASTPQE